MIPNLANQIETLFSPLNPDQLMMNQIYCVHSLIGFALMYQSYKSREHTWLAYPAYLWSGLRNSF